MTATCDRLHRILREREIFRFPFDGSFIPTNGIYVLYESGELGHGGERIVRVGTHTGSGQLRSRLKQHFLNENKDRSIFRKNIGRALLSGEQDPFLKHWELDLTTSVAKTAYGEIVDFDKQKAVERRVTDCIQNRFHFVVISVPMKDDRLELEARMISTVFDCPDCRPSQQWLGLHSPKVKIRDSGLWQVNELCGELLSEKHFLMLDQLGAG